MKKNVAHLTTVVHVGVNAWQARCDCGWKSDPERLKRRAIYTAEMHWLASPLVQVKRT